MAFIYVITNDINGKQYVGKTNFSIEKRFREHIKDSKKDRCEKRPLYNAMNKYGIEHFHIKILEECSAEESANKEIYWINKLNTYKNGYNATLGGDSKKYYNYKELANAYLELGTLKAVCQKFNCDIDTVKAACKDNNIVVISGQQIIKEKYSKAVVMLDKDSLKVLRTFSSLTEASNFLNKRDGSHISDVCKGKRKTAYGYKWKFK